MGRTKAKLIVYRRVSTARQGTSGLGLEGQNAVVADAPPAGVEPVEHVGDLVALVILQGEPPDLPPSPAPASAPAPVGATAFQARVLHPWPTPHASARIAGTRALQVGRTPPCLTNRMTSPSS